ncbi:MAG TPA: hypothetical protein VGY53_00915, partial [Isosphaeraceae bacterium]|nr:hypothetical protein [Isosphaeraceae bacterium]
AILLLATMVYAPDLKADWRAARELLERASLSNSPFDCVYVVTEDPRNTVEVETARYYLGQRFRVLPLTKALADSQESDTHSGERVVFATSLRRGQPVAALPTVIEHAYAFEYGMDVPGLRLAWRIRRSGASD